MSELWVVSDPSDKDILKEILGQTDRAAAIIAGAYLEDRLLEAVKARLNRDERIEGKLFKGSGALTAHSARIDLGFLLGIYGEKVHRVLHTMRRIRNEFAHNAEKTTFESQKIKSLCKNMAPSGGAEFTITSPEGKKNHVKIDLSNDGSPKGQFLSALKFMIVVLDMETKIAPLRKPAPPLLPEPGQHKASPEKT